ncbi:MAG: AsmA-like C-terminal domain-containing protein [Planctomycetia bacterium]|nr:AsmA-like C-terminal domain-containing protein [Planctomycetia bacterium]
MVQKILDKKFPQLNVSFESVKLIDTQGVLLRNIHCEPKIKSADSVVSFNAQEVIIECPIDIKTILNQKAVPQKITILRPTFFIKATHFQQLSQDFLKFKPFSQIDDIPFPVEFREGKIIYENNDNSQPKQLIFGGIQGTLLPPEYSQYLNAESNNKENAQAKNEDKGMKLLNDKAVDDFVSENDEEFKNSAIEPLTFSNQENKSISTFSQNVWRLKFSASNPLVRRINVSGKFDAVTKHWQLNGQIEQLDVGPELTKFVPLSKNVQSVLKTFESRTSFQFQLESDPKLERQFRVNLTGEAFRGNVKLPFLKYPISDIYIKYSLYNDLFKIERLTARNGSAYLLIDYLQNGLNSNPQEALLRVQLDEFALDDEILKGFYPFFPENLRKLLNEYQFSTLAKIQFVLNRRDNKWNPEHLSLDCIDLEGLYRKFPYKLENMSGQLTLDDKAKLNFLFRSHNDQTLNQAEQILIRGDLADVLSDAVGQIEIEGLNYSLNKKLFEAIPKSFRQEIQKLHPDGLIDASLLFKLNSNSKSSTSQLDESNFSAPLNFSQTNNDQTVFAERNIGISPPNNSFEESNAQKPVEFCYLIGIRNASVRYERFPFMISDISGLIKFENEVWSFSNFRGNNGSANVKATGYFAPNNLNYLNRNGLVSEPSSNSGFSNEEQNRRFYLQLELNSFPLGEELQNALIHSQYRELLEKFHLRGKANAIVQLSYETESKKFDLELEAEPIPELTSIKPDSFPYELKQLEGHVFYRKGEILVDHLRGRNGQVICSAKIHCRFLPNGSWILDLMPIQVDQVHLDHDLQKAVPSSLLTFFDQLKLSGYFNLSGRARFYKTSLDAPLVSFWNIGVVMHQNVAQVVMPIQNICGRAKLCGSAIEKQSFQIHGELDVDSLCLNDIQITRLTGPFYFDGQTFLFGRDVPAWTSIPFYQNDFFKQETDQYIKDHYYQNQALKESIQSNNSIPAPKSSSFVSDVSNNVSNNGNKEQKTTLLTESAIVRRPIQGLLFRGNSELSGKVFLTTPIVYQLNFLLKDAYLDEITRDLMPQSDPLKGKAIIFSFFQGEGKNIATLKGEGGLILKEAELYELPQIMKILQLFSVREPDRTAFNSSAIDFRVFGNRLCLDRVILEGNSLTLFGNGWLTLEEKVHLIDLTMNSRLGNTKNQIPVLSDVLGGATDQISQIRIEGPLSDPVIRADRFPGIKKAIWSVFPEQEPEPSSAMPTESPRPIRDAWKKLFQDEKK